MADGRGPCYQPRQFYVHVMLERRCVAPPSAAFAACRERQRSGRSVTASSGSQRRQPPCLIRYRGMPQASVRLLFAIVLIQFCCRVRGRVQLQQRQRGVVAAVQRISRAARRSPCSRRQRVASSQRCSSRSRKYEASRGDTKMEQQKLRHPTPPGEDKGEV